ncbi:hypothetical protein [Amycolatopsis jejuensis]|uniref:hypothetical protein n=1 Tax=Amycolatopsis jejuensis TaxID=330084 RepID=UPI000524E6C7|nr:hypothetical protein [Amycolatopsis jejuensis]
MADDFYLDPAAYRNVTRQLSEIGEDLGSSYRRLARVLDDNEGSWGYDEIGKNFQEGYYKKATEYRDGYSKGEVNITKSATVSQKNADNLAKLDDDSARKLDSEYDPNP